MLNLSNSFLTRTDLTILRETSEITLETEDEPLKIFSFLSLPSNRPKDRERNDSPEKKAASVKGPHPHKP